MDHRGSRSKLASWCQKFWPRDRAEMKLGLPTSSIHIDSDFFKRNSGQDANPSRCDELSTTMLQNLTR